VEILRRAVQTIWDILETTAFALGFVTVTYLFLFQTGEVHGTSSFPTWKDNERFITDKISYRLGQPMRGEFIVLQSPTNPETDF
jgi:signal peptidase I